MMWQYYQKDYPQEIIWYPAKGIVTLKQQSLTEKYRRSGCAWGCRKLLMLFQITTLLKIKII